MRKIFTKLAVIVLLFTTKQVSAQVKFGVTAGTQINFTTTTFVDDVKKIATPTFGIVSQFNLGNGLMFRPSLNYVQDGFKSLESITTQLGGGRTQVTDLEENLKIPSLQVPLDLVFGVKAGSGKFLMSVAPVLSIALKGKYEMNETSTTTGSPTQTFNIERDLEFSGINASLDRVDWGSKFGIGYQFKNGMQINAAYKAALKNVSADNSEKLKNNSLSLSLSYFFINK
jgi:hypothetical protein